MTHVRLNKAVTAKTGCDGSDSKSHSEKAEYLGFSAPSRAVTTCQGEAEAETFSKTNEQNAYKYHKASMRKVIVNQWETGQVSA